MPSLQRIKIASHNNRSISSDTMYFAKDVAMCSVIINPLSLISVFSYTKRSQSGVGAWLL